MSISNIANNLQQLSNDKISISNALVNKGVTEAVNHGFDDFATDILNIENSYSISDEGKVVNNGSLIAQTSTSANTNGVLNTTYNNSVNINVPNSYTVSDEGKVVSNGELISQTAYPTEIIENGTYNTINNNEVTVNVSNSPTIPLSKGLHCKPVSNKYLYDIPYFERDYSFTAEHLVGRDVWTDGVSLYCSTKSGNSFYHYVYDTDSNRWQTTSWSNFPYFSGQDVWTDSENIYVTNYDESYRTYSHYTINTTTHTCSYGVPWTGFSNFLGKNVWNYEGNIYCFGYKLNKSTNTWETNSFSGDGQYIWTDGNNLYSSNGYSHTMFDTTTSTWVTKSWNGISNVALYGYNIWTDGNHIYCNVGSSAYILNTSTSTWSNNTIFKNSISIQGYDIFTYNGNIYGTYSGNSTPYKLINNNTQSYTTNDYFPYMGI